MGKTESYVLSVICAAVLCAILGNLSDKKTASGTVLKLISGVFLTFTVIRPITEIKLDQLSLMTSDIQAEAQTAALMGEEMTQEAYAAIIKQETEAYILDKATALNGRITAQVSLGEDMLPQSVTLSGSLSPYGRAQLAAMIAEDLGIPKEMQQWSE